MNKLDRTWKNCLRMWKWISETRKPGMNVCDLKDQWLKENHFTRKIEWECFFCEWAITHGQDCADMYQGCPHCPGTMVSSRFKCSVKAYRFDRNPKAFYRKLVELDKKRKGTNPMTEHSKAPEILTDKQLYDLRDDIGAGLVMIVDKKHYYQLSNAHDALVAACENAVKQMQDKPVQAQGEWEQGLMCGLEDMSLDDRYMACRYGYDKALDKVQEWIIEEIEAALDLAKGE